MIRKYLTASVIVSLGLAMMMMMTPASAADSDPDPAGGLLKSVTGLLQSKSAPKNVAPAVEAPQPPSSDSDIPPNETEDPSSPDHGSTRGVEAKIGDTDIAGVSQDNATVNDDDSTTANANLLSLGGQQVLGANADSNGANEDHFGDFLAPLCDVSGGALCLKLLYADAVATDDGSTSHAQSSTGILDACLLGTDPEGPCTGVAAGVANSDAQADRDQESGRTTASSSYETAGLCVPDPVTGCAIGASVLNSFGEADSGGPTSSADRGSSLLGAEVLGFPLGPVDQPAALPLAPLLNLFLNQGETYLGPGVAGHAQDALKLTLLPGILDVFAGVGHTETLVHNDGGRDDDDCKSDCDDDDGDDDGEDDGRDDSRDESDSNGALPDTGGPLSGLLALGLFGVAAGSGAIAYGRRGRGAVR